MFFNRKRPQVCHYGNTGGAFSSCDRVVQPGEGVRYADHVFCSEEHAYLDQAEANF